MALLSPRSRVLKGFVMRGGGRMFHPMQALLIYIGFARGSRTLLGGELSARRMSNSSILVFDDRQRVNSWIDRRWPIGPRVRPPEMTVK